MPTGISEDTHLNGTSLPREDGRLAFRTKEVWLAFRELSTEYFSLSTDKLGYVGFQGP